MATLVSRLTNTGTLFACGSFDEITKTVTSTDLSTVYSAQFDEVTGMGISSNMLTYFDAGKIESYNFTYNSQRLIDLNTSSSIIMQNTTTWVSTFSGGLSYPVVPGTVTGTEPWVQLQDSIFNNRSAGTISAWIQYTAVSRTGDYHDNYGQAIVSRQKDTVGTWGHLAVSGYVNSSGNPLLGTTGKIYWHPRNGIAPANSTANLAYNTVYHIAVTFNTTECRFYINGLLDSTTAGDYSVPSSQESTYGTAVAVWRYGGEYYMPWSGYIYSMKFYNSVLSADQVAQNYNADAARFALTPITNPPVQRQSSTGTLLVTGLFDEVNMILQNANLYFSPATTFAGVADTTVASTLPNLGISGAIYNATTSTGAPQVATQNGVKVLYFDGSLLKNLQMATEIDLSTNSSAFFVGYQTANRMIALGGSNASGNGNAFFGWGGSNNTSILFRNSSDGGQTLTGLQSVAGLKVFGMIQGTSTFTYYDNSTIPTNGTYVSGTYKFGKVGARDYSGSFNSQLSTGYLGDIVAFNRAVSNDEAVLIMKLLKERYNIQ